MFAVGDSVVTLIAVDASVPADSVGVIVDVGGLMFDDSPFVDFGDVIVECDPDWLRAS